MLLIDSLKVTQDTTVSIKPVLPQLSAADTFVLSPQSIQAIIKATHDGPSPTDWIQAGAAVVGVLAAIIGSWYAIKAYRHTVDQQQGQITDQQKQLDTLAQIAQGLTNQINHNKEQRRLNIRPNLIMVNEAEFMGDGIQVLITLENSGDTIAGIKIYSSDGLNYKQDTDSPVMHKKDRKLFMGRRKDSNERIDQIRLIIHYMDKDQNEYVQQVYGSFNNGVTYTTPQLVGHNTDWQNLSSERKKKYGTREQEVAAFLDGSYNQDS